jgi:hypothetical protein
VKVLKTGRLTATSMKAALTDMVFATTIPCIGEDEFVGIHYSIVVVKNMFRFEPFIIRKIAANGTCF